MRVSKLLSIAIWIVGLLGLVEKVNYQPNKRFSVNGWQEFSMNPIATDVTMVD
jgi:hypothetical protein